MSKRDYDPKVISIFEIVGSYYVDVFYNSLYLKARDSVKGGQSTSITDAYRTNVINYMVGIAKRKDLYMGVVKKMHKYFQRLLSFRTIIFSDFEDKILSQFIPNEYYKDFTENHKDSTLHEIVIKSVNAFGEVILKHDMIKRIIDDHLNRENITILQNGIVEIFILQREEYFSKFAREISKANGNIKESKKLLDNLKAALLKETQKRCNAESDRDRAINIISQLTQTVNSLKEKLREPRLQPVPTIPLAVLPKFENTIHSTPERVPAIANPPQFPEMESDSESDDMVDVYEKQQQELMQKFTRRDPTPVENGKPPAVDLMDDPWMSI